MRDQQLRQDLVALLPRLRRFAYALTGSLDDADDVVQTACERALTRFDQFEPGTRLDSWMFRIVQTVTIDRARYNTRRKPGANIDDLVDMGMDARIHESTEARMALERIREEMQNLSEDQRAVLVLVAIEGKSYQETADILGVPIGTVMSRLARARKYLLTAINQPQKPQVQASGGGA